MLLRVQKGVVVNRKAVYRVLKQKGWLVLNVSAPYALACKVGRVGRIEATNAGPWM